MGSRSRRDASRNSSSDSRGPGPPASTRAEGAGRRARDRAERLGWNGDGAQSAFRNAYSSSSANYTLKGSRISSTTRLTRLGATFNADPRGGADRVRHVVLLD